VIKRISFALFCLLIFSRVTAGENAFADEAIPFIQVAGIKYVTVEINGVPMNLIFDTGSNSVVLNSDALQRLGIMEVSRTGKFPSYTAGGIVESYVVTVSSIKAGNVERSNYDIAYVPSSTASLLGASFFSNYNYYVDEDNSVIRLIPKGSFIFERPQEPASEGQSQRTGSGRIEVEMDGKKYIYGKGWQDTESESRVTNDNDSSNKTTK
jgi:clan AA aspartic protease (TIGR02281 family)